MLDKPTIYPLSSSSALLTQQELQLRQYTSAAISARERERERISPEPHLEIMRPVSPFQNKRQLAHQQPQTEEAPHFQRQKDQRPFNSHYQTHSSSRPYKQSYAKVVANTQQISQSNAGTTLKSHPSSHTAPSSSRTRLNTRREASRGTRTTSRDTDISPALKMMNYDTSAATNSSDHEQGQTAANTAGMLAPPDRGEMARSTSPEGGKRRNPGWRKPVPKYIPTPPSTPPTTTMERLPSARGREEPVPPVPSASSILNMQTTRTHPAKLYTLSAPMSSSQSPPPRPVRSATDHQVPVMFRDLTASKTRLGTIQHPAQAHTRQNAGLSRVTTTPIRNVAQTTRAPRKEDPSKHRVQVSAALGEPQVPPQAYSSNSGRASPNPLTRPSRSPSPQPAHERTDSRQDSLVHPQPRKVPSLARLVAMVIPSRSQSRSPSRPPSPGITLTTVETTDMPTTATLSETSSEHMPAAIPSLSVDPPSPAVVKEEANIMFYVPTSALLQPDQVQLPPSRGSSARSSPSPSPQPSPRSAPAPLPIRSRSRSPTPAVIPQHEPPVPVFSSSPPGPPTVSKTKISSPSQPALSVKLAKEREATIVMAQVSNVPVKQIANPPRDAQVTFNVAQENIVGNSTLSATWLPRTAKTPVEKSGATPAGDSSPSYELGNAAPQAARVSEQAGARRPPSPKRHQSAPPQIAGTITEKASHTVNDVTEDAPVETSAHERCVPSRESNPPIVRTKAVERIVLEDDSMSAPSYGRTTHSGRTETLIKPSVNTVDDESLKTFDMCAGVVPVVQEFHVPARRRPVPVAMSEHAQISRESGLVTPPDTPPGSTTATLNTNTEDSLLVTQERVHGAQRSDKDMEPISRPRSPVASVPVKASLSKASMRRRTLIQDERPALKDENDVVLTRPFSSIGAIATSAAVSDAALQETTVPPLPSDWKETITSVARSDVGPIISPPVPLLTEAAKISDVLSRTKPVAPQKTKIRDAEITDKSVTREVLKTHAEHEITVRLSQVLDFHTHNVDTRHGYQVPEKVAEQEQYLQLSRTPPRKFTSPEPASLTTPAVKPDPVHNYPPSKNTLNLVPSEEPVRSRSPVPRRKVPKEYDDAVNTAQERPGDHLDTPASTAVDIVEPQVLSNPSPQRSAVPTSRSHSSGLKRKPRTTRAQSDRDDGDVMIARPTDQIDDAQISRRAHGPSADENIPASADEPSANCLSPPQKLQSLASRKRVPFNGSETSLVQSSVKDATRDGPSSPYFAGRSLPTTSQSQPPSRPPRHLHGQHKRLPPPEVTQAYRPPTPPIPSHYKKKGSNDMLPTEPPTFMKPAVHVIYPDTSTSHGHSLSGDSVLNMNTFKSNNIERTQPTMGLSSLASLEAIGRARSPSPAVPAHELDEDDETSPEAYPQVPPKTRRHETNTHGSPSGSDRLSEFAIQHATRGQVRYPSEPVGQARAHILMLPPNSNDSRNRIGDNADGNFNSNMRSRQTQQPHAKKAARSHSEKVWRKNENVKPLARSRSTPIPSSRQRSRRGFWRIFGLWARVFMAKFRTWTAPAPSPSHSSEYGGYYETY